MKYYASKISENIHETPEGYLVCVGVPIARTGDMLYAEGETPLETGDDGTVTVSRSPEEVFRPETVASFEGKPITILHPEDFVSPKNWSSLAKGILQNVRRGEGDQENDLIADLLITDGDAINLVKNGLREVSCGYDTEYVQTGRGRGIQKNILGNHLALVDEGRAGASYAINDHKGKAQSMKVRDKIKAIFAKAQDEALKAHDEDGTTADEEKKAPPVAAGYDEVMKAVKDLGEKVTAMAEGKKSADADPAAEEKKKDDAPPAKDEEKPSLEERLSKLEAAVSKLLENQANDEDAETADDDGDEDQDESEDDDFEESTMTGDTASRIEILAPGMKAAGRDVKAKALKAAYATTDGKGVIDQFTGGKAPDLKNEKLVNTLFIATSEILKNQRTSELSRTKTFDFQPQESPGAMTAEKMNEINSKHYGSKTAH